MAEVIHLIRWKTRLTWRLYTRHTLASLETLLFFLVFVVWIILSCWVLVYVVDWGLHDLLIPRALVYCDLLTFIFVLWLLLSLSGYRLNESYDLNRLKVFPLPFRSVYLASILGPFTDLAVLLPLSGLVTVFLASGPAPDKVPIGVLMIIGLLFLMVVSGITLVNTLYVLLPRLNLVKVGMVVLVGVLIWDILLNMGLVGYPMPNFYILFRPDGIEYFRPYPAGQIGIALDAYLARQPSEMWRSLGGFAAWTGGVLVLNYLILRYWWESDLARRTETGRVREDDPASRALDWVGRLLAPLVGRPTWAVTRKDMLEFALRNPYFMLYKVLPGSIAPIIILLSMHYNLNNVSRLQNSPELAQAALLAAFTVVLFIVVAQANLFSGNQFGLEDLSIRNVLVLPTPRRCLILGKNLFMGSLLLIDALVISFLVLLFFPTAYAFFASFTLLVTLFLLILSLGNFTSAIWPYWMPLDRPSFTLRSTVILGLVNLGVTLILALVFVPALAMVALPYALGKAWIAYLLMPVAIAYGVGFHRLTLNSAVSLLESNEFLVLRRVSDREEL